MCKASRKDKQRGGNKMRADEIGLNTPLYESGIFGVTILKPHKIGRDDSDNVLISISNGMVFSAKEDEAVFKNMDNNSLFLSNKDASDYAKQKIKEKMKEIEGRILDYKAELNKLNEKLKSL